MTRLLLFTVAAASCVVGLLAAAAADAWLRVPIPILGDWAYIVLASNPGIAFGIQLPWPFQEILILLALVLVLIIALRSWSIAAHTGYGLILGGALANVIDRAGDGFVTDYFAVGGFPVFNIPDSCISIGLVILLAESFGMISRKRITS